MAKMGKPRGVARYTCDGLFIEGYRSISLAAKLGGISAASISNACKSPYKEVGGFKWRYFAYSKPKVTLPNKPRITEAQRLARVDDVLNKIIGGKQYGQYWLVSTINSRGMYRYRYRYNTPRYRRFIMSKTYDRITPHILGSRRRCLTRMRDAEWRNLQAAVKTMYDLAAMFLNEALNIMDKKGDK